MPRLVLSAAAVLFCLTLADASGADTKAPTVTMAVNQASDNSLLIIAVKKGFLEKEGLNGRIQLFDDGAAALRAVVAGQADVGINTAVPQLAARARGGKIVQVMTAYLSGRINGTVVKTSAIAKPQDFAGKTIAVARGSGAHYHQAWFIDHYGLQNKVNVVFLDVADQIPALARGDIQGMWTWEPFLSKAVETVPGTKILGRTIDDGLQFPGTVAIREEIATKQPDVAVKIVKALIATIDWMKTNPLEAGKVSNEGSFSSSRWLLSRSSKR